MSSTVIQAEVSSADRIGFTLFLAMTFHALLVFGVSFSAEDKQSAAPTLEVTLAQSKSQESPDKADYLAQFDQQASGSLEDKAIPKTPKQADFVDNEIQKTLEQSAIALAKQTPVKVLQTVITQRSEQTIDAVKTQPLEQAEQNTDANNLLQQKSLEIASLEALLDQQRQQYAKRPRIRRLTTISTKSSVDALYLYNWRTRIETIGNLNYPQEAKRRKLYGSLRLLVAILPNGTIKEVKVLESSGHKILDDAALRIVRLAAPFAAFSQGLKKDIDVLEIIRTWQFQKNDSLVSF